MLYLTDTKAVDQAFGVVVAQVIWAAYPLPAVTRRAKSLGVGAREQRFIEQLEKLLCSISVTYAARKGITEMLP